mmetsp:Transcript_10784/g.33377  ORF Transcript_10784/g.33377 Transcript_10784/m.33377 type:complete len:436 (+) Transcript_10784:111-1418(+)
MHGSSSTDKWGNDPATNVARKGRLSVLMRPISAWKPASSGGASTRPFSARSWSPGSSKPLACEESDTEETNKVRAGGALGPQKSSAASPLDLRRSSGMGGGTGAPRSRANERSRRAWRAALREASSCHGAAPSDAVRRWRRGGLSMATSGRSPSSDDGRRRREERGGGGGGGGGRVDGGAGANRPPAGAERGIVCLTNASLMPRGPSVKSTSNALARHNREAKSSRASRRRVSDTSRGVSPAWHRRAAACSAAPSPSSLSHVAERNKAASAEALPQAAATCKGVAPMASGAQASAPRDTSSSTTPARGAPKAPSLAAATCKARAMVAKAPTGPPLAPSTAAARTARASPRAIAACSLNTASVSGHNSTRAFLGASAPNLGTSCDGCRRWARFGASSSDNSRPMLCGASSSWKGLQGGALGSFRPPPRAAKAAAAL